jgi:hypothetical protein
MDFLKSISMKKMLLFLLILVSMTGSLKAQTLAEWFQQKKTQKKYLLQQIAALQIYIGYAQKGYQIAKEGLTTIGGFTRGEFNLHADYFNSLKIVNPEIKHYAKVAEIIGLEIKIVQNYNSTFRKLKSTDAFSNDELSYIRSVFTNLLDDCEKTLDELIAVTTDGKLEMTDDERMARIDKLYLDMQDKFTFCNSFSNDAKLLAASRIKEQTEVKTSRALQGIKNK